MGSEMKFRSIMKKILFILLFIADEMKWNFVSQVVGVKQPIKKSKQTDIY